MATQELLTLEPEYTFTPVAF